MATTQQSPSDRAVDQLHALYQTAIDEYESDGDAVTHVADNAQDFAMTIVASTILNLDTALVK